ncbi:hypothetical protein BST81_22180 [Leptolyngbya sp. 'hensonii']|uniref:hypothetical protein n=1 Tax=Leptolyngbya sp. 'hensonii' TaxID=1922337 RepID=UPI0009502F93|nr:hypothetical protein [Leptolyngbya sp. 'hensonii']OLP16306.1 hypothetical protein BST81_22180 [Leptolyngbya sp. 'hensonii']
MARFHLTAILLGSVLMVEFSPVTIAQTPAACNLQDSVGNLINLPGVCKSQPRPASLSPRLITGSRSAQCQKLHDITTIRLEGSFSTQVQVNASTRVSGSNQAQTTSSVTVTPNSQSRIATRADLIQGIQNMATLTDDQVKQLTGITFQDSQLDAYRGLMIQYGKQRSQKFRQLLTAKLTDDQLGEQFGKTLLGVDQPQPVWSQELEKYCPSTRKTKTLQPF